MNKFQNIKSKVESVPLIVSHPDASVPSADAIPEATAYDEKPLPDPSESPKTVTEVISDDGYTRRIIHLAGSANQEVQVFGDNSNATMRRTPNSLSVEAHNVL
uniref:Uncharacterized protein n=1 Tax=Panagrellus redivivus TaxID=6233 RepID=A0A7E4VGN4_PANRE